MDENIPALSEILSKKALFDEYQKSVIWQSKGDDVVRRIMKFGKPYVRRFNDLPKNFLPSMMDQYLAVLWHKNGNRENVPCGQPWLYHSFIVVESIADDLYRCCAEDGMEFILFSPAVTTGLTQENRHIFLTVLLNMDGWYMTYGPVLGWSGLGPDDFKYLAKNVAAQMYRNSGLSAVIQSNPFPFWASFILAEIPPIYHKGKFSEWCTLAGRFRDGVLPVLPKTWEQEEKGNRIRWIYNKKDPLNKRCIYYNKKTGDALLVADNADSFKKTYKAAGTGFDDQNNEPEVASIAMISYVGDVLKKNPEFFKLEKIFEP